MDDSGKMVRIFEEMRPKVNCRCRNLQENIFSEISKVVEKFQNFHKRERAVSKIMAFYILGTGFQKYSIWNSIFENMQKLSYFNELF